MSCLPGLVQSVSLTPKQSTVDPSMHRRLPNTHRQVGLSLLRDHGPSLPGPGMHMVLSAPSRSLSFPSPLGVLDSNPTALQSQISWGFSGPLPDPQVGKPVAGPRTSATVWKRFGITVLQFVGHLVGGSIVGPTATPATTSRTAGARAPVPRLARASAGDTQTLTGRSGSVSCWIPASSPSVCCAQGFVCSLRAPLRFDFKHSWASPIFLFGLLLCPWTWGYLILVGSNILLSMVVQQLVAIFGVLAGDEHTSFYSTILQVHTKRYHLHIWGCWCSSQKS